MVAWRDGVTSGNRSVTKPTAGVGHNEIAEEYGGNSRVLPTFEVLESILRHTPLLMPQAYMYPFVTTTVLKDSVVIPSEISIQRVLESAMYRIVEDTAMKPLP